MDILGNCDVRPSFSSGFRIEVSEARERRHSNNPIPRLPSAWERAPSSHDSPVGRVMCSRVLRVVLLLDCVCLGHLATPSARPPRPRRPRTSETGNSEHAANTIRGSLYILSLHYFSGKTATKEGRNQPRRSLAHSVGHFPRGILAKRGIFLANEPRTPSVTPKVRPSASDRQRCPPDQLPEPVQVWYQSLP